MVNENDEWGWFRACGGGTVVTISGPVEDFTEACFEHELVADPDGRVPVAVVDRDLGLGVYQVFSVGQLPHHTVWRMMGEDTYALATEPSTNRNAGRRDARERGELLHLEPDDVRPYGLEIGALVGGEAIDAFAARVGKLIPVT